MNNEDNNNNNNDPWIDIDTMMKSAKKLVKIAKELEKKKSVWIEEVKKLIEKANQQSEVSRELFSVLQHPIDIDTLLCRIRFRKQRSKQGKTRVSAAEYDQYATLVAGLSGAMRYRFYKKLCRCAGTSIESFKKNWLKSVEAKCKEVEQLRLKAKQQAEVAINAISIAAKKLFEIAKELEKKESVSVEDVEQLIEEANQLEKRRAEVARGLFAVQQGKKNKTNSECSDALKQVHHLCKKILLDEEVKVWVDIIKNLKNATQAHWLKWKGELPVFELNEIISKIENFDKDSIYVFTDGSCKIDKTNRMNDASGVGIIIIFTEADHQRIITMCGPICDPPKGHSSQYAELYAIEMALYAIYLLDRVGQKVVIFTDNLETVEAFNQYKERGMDGQVCSLDFNQMKSMKSRDNKYLPIYKLVQLFRVDNDKVPLFNLQFEHVYSTHSCEDVNSRIPTKPRNPGNEEADKLAAEGRRATSWTTTLFKAATPQTTDAFEVLGLESEGCDVLGSAEEEPTLMDCANAMDIDID